MWRLYQVVTNLVARPFTPTRSVGGSQHSTMFVRQQADVRPWFRNQSGRPLRYGMSWRYHFDNARNHWKQSRDTRWLCAHRHSTALDFVADDRLFLAFLWLYINIKSGSILSHHVRTRINRRNGLPISSTHVLDLSVIRNRRSPTAVITSPRTDRWSAGKPFVSKKIASPVTVRRPGATSQRWQDWCGTLTGRFSADNARVYQTGYPGSPNKSLVKCADSFR